jgi:hypothetical protein
VQLHDALHRTKEVCSALQLQANGEARGYRLSGAINETTRIADANLEALEMFFKGEVDVNDLEGHFAALASDLKRIWIEEKS